MGFAGVLITRHDYWSFTEYSRFTSAREPNSGNSLLLLKNGNWQANYLRSGQSISLQEPTLRQRDNQKHRDPVLWQCWCRVPGAGTASPNWAQRAGADLGKPIRYPQQYARGFPKSVRADAPSLEKK